MRIIADFPISRERLARETPGFLDRPRPRRNPRPSSTRWWTTTSDYNANIHRGVYEIAARATEAFEALASSRPLYECRTCSEVMWTRNTTEAINMVAYSVGTRKCSAGDAILTHELEHHSEPGALATLGRTNRCAAPLHPVRRSAAFRSRRFGPFARRLSSWSRISHVSNTLGTIAPLETIVSRAHAAGAVVLVDGAQGAPHLPRRRANARCRLLRFQRPQDVGANRNRRALRSSALLEAMPPFLAAT